MLKWLCSLFVIYTQLFAVDSESLSKILIAPTIDHLTLWPSTKKDAPVLIAMHGYGNNYTLGSILRSNPAITDHIISFNFPDANRFESRKHYTKLSFGTINDFLAVFTLLKLLVIDHSIDAISLYGFSSGGGSVINTVAILNSNRFEPELERIGITKSGRKQILSALQRGKIILDAPLKSAEELIDAKGQDPESCFLAQQYARNDLRPIDSLKYWNGLSLDVLLYFEKGDEALTNRDDALFIERMKTYNKGKTLVIVGQTGGHCSYHAPLWEAYRLGR